MSELTPEIVKNFWSFMHTRYDSSAVNKSDSTSMEMVAGFLDLIKVVDKDDFMKNFTTTIGTTIYIPFEIGVEGDYSLWDQIEVCVHEHQHVIQYRREGPLKFSFEYIASTTQRAWYEAEAYRCDLEMYHWKTGNVITPKRLASHLDSYGVSDEDILFVEQYMDSSLLTVAEGGIISEAAQVAIEWLERYHPEVRSV